MRSPDDASRRLEETDGCRVCGAIELGIFARIDGKAYWRCKACEAVLLDTQCLPSPDEELEHYRHHQNDEADPRYRRFLSRLADPLLTRLPPGSEGLDYGCGPGPALAAILREKGHAMQVYDPFFAPDASALERRYDFIVCTEAAEHFHHPAREFARLDGLLKPGGWLGLMTCFRTDDRLFEAWHYRRDPTHVIFYREETLVYLARQFGWQCEIAAKDVALMRKAGVAGP